MRRLVLFLAGLGFLHGCWTAAAGTLDRTLTGDDVVVAFTSPFSDMPPGGCVPYHINIRNDRKEPGAWRISFHEMPAGYARGSSLYERELSVAANATGDFDVAVPIPTAGEGNYNSLMLDVQGPGFDNSHSLYRYVVYSNPSGSNRPFAVISKGVLGNAGTGPLESLYKDRGDTYYGSEIEAENLPTDWRAYSGVARIVLSDTEWLTLAPARRQAITDAVAQGGRLTLLTSENLAAKIPQLQLPSPDGMPGAYGFGDIAVQNVGAFPLGATELDQIAQNDPAPSRSRISQGFTEWPLRASMGVIAISGGFIFAFVFLFGALVGPVNLFVFARGKKRFRLFWTTPLISILASLMLIIGILFTDGIGGHGKQIVAIYSLPGSTSEAVIQEQVARTAVLFSSRWHSDVDYLLQPVSARQADDVEVGFRGYRGAPDDGLSGESYVQIGNDYSGNWFRSRTVSGQYLQAMRPSRSCLTVVNPTAVATRGEAPVVLSSFPADLAPVFLVDGKGKVWKCADVPPGHQQPCVPSSHEELRNFWSDVRSDTGGKLGPLLERAGDQAGNFYAAAPATPGENLGTLDEVHWQVVRQIYLGPWVASTATEASP